VGEASKNSSPVRGPMVSWSYEYKTHRDAYNGVKNTDVQRHGKTKNREAKAV